MDPNERLRQIKADERDEGWMVGWQAAIDWLAEYGADRPTAFLIDDMRTRTPANRSEIERLRQWKAEAIMVLDSWGRVHGALGNPGELGQSKAAASEIEAARLRGQAERIAQAIEASCDEIANQPCRPCRQAAAIARTTP